MNVCNVRLIGFKKLGYTSTDPSGNCRNVSPGDAVAAKASVGSETSSEYRVNGKLNLKLVALNINVTVVANLSLIS